ncbi:hypothetical protein KTR9_5006 (plasmid) [Gordonia sp. KTR9]|nr:hypothetical protein KTR9_5006 [Gordonia sp. KTR9]
MRGRGRCLSSCGRARACRRRGPGFRGPGRGGRRRSSRRAFLFRCHVCGGCSVRRGLDSRGGRGWTPTAICPAVHLCCRAGSRCRSGRRLRRAPFRCRLPT